MNRIPHVHLHSVTGRPVFRRLEHGDGLAKSTSNQGAITPPYPYTVTRPFTETKQVSRVDDRGACSERPIYKSRVSRVPCRRAHIFPQWRGTRCPSVCEMSFGRRFQTFILSIKKEAATSTQHRPQPARARQPLGPFATSQGVHGTDEHEKIAAAMVTPGATMINQWVLGEI